jgi:outer membrane protein, heavy metal efflux system
VRVQASSIRHPLRAPVTLDLQAGLRPEDAAVVAVLINPALRAARDQRGIAAAQLLQAGILPNPQISGSLDYLLGGTLTPDLVTGYGFGASWDIQALIERGARKSAAGAGKRHHQRAHPRAGGHDWPAHL